MMSTLGQVVLSYHPDFTLGYGWLSSLCNLAKVNLLSYTPWPLKLGFPTVRDEHLEELTPLGETIAFAPPTSFWRSYKLALRFIVFTSHYMHRLHRYDFLLPHMNRGINFHI